MNEFEGTAVLVGLFALRCIAPLIATLVIGYLMNRLVDRWESEEIASERPESITVEEPILPTGRKLPSVNIPCWIFKNCSDEMLEKCVAHKHPSLPCWLVRLRYEGVLPDGCPDCPMYEASGTFAAGD
jgi:hypothetical protein